MMIRTAATLLAGGLSLAGCDAAPDNAAVASGEAASTTTATRPAPAAFVPGQWSMTAEITDVQAAGAQPQDAAELAQLREALVGKPQTKAICLDQASIDGGLEELFVTPGADCSTDAKEIAGGTINATYLCRTPQGGGAQIRTAGSYTSDTMTTSTQIMTPGPTNGTSLTLVAKTTGKRVGAC